MEAAGTSPPPSIEKLLEHASTGMHEREPKCCCGRPQCAFLAHNSAALEGLEKDLVSAAQIGQALLVRHESHMAEAEEQRLRMMDTIGQLETEKVDLEASNAATIDENRRLLDRLEELNGAASVSDARVNALTADLEATRAELDRLVALSQRTALLEEQLAALEAEQYELQTRVFNTEEGKRSAVQRWRRAEVTIGQLQDQVDRIEKEAREERDRHVEVLGRMEKRRAVERELELAAGRLKGAAAMTSLGRHDHGGGSVVSHFVKDILQDNANLQSGVLELRELLTGSNAEVETLRDQLRLHRPLDDGEEARPTLGDELRTVEPAHDALVLAQAPEPGSSMHVHHHYHAPSITVRKAKKKRPTVNTTRYAPSSGASTPVATRPRDWYHGSAASISTILEHTSASVPPMGHQHRLSAQSNYTVSSVAASSVPSSPRRASSVFDPIDGAFDASRPTTPASSACASPLMLPRDAPFHRAAKRSVSGPVTTQVTARAILPLRGHPDSAYRSLELSHSPASPFGPETIAEEAERAGWHPDPEPDFDQEPHFTDELSPRPLLRRAASHESLISVSGMDIHTLRSRPSQLLMHAGAFSPRSASPHGGSVASFGSPQAATSHAVAIGVRPAFQRPGVSSGDLARSLLSSAAAAQDRPSLTRKVGGWVWGKWGVGVAPGVGPAAGRQADRPFVRPMGVNQPGAIQGLLPPRKAPIQIETKQVDEQLLRESLADAQVAA